MPRIQSNQLRTIRNWTKGLPNKIRIFYSRYECSAWYCSQSWLLGCCLHDGIWNWKPVRGTRWIFLPWCGRGIIWRSWTEVILFYIYVIWYLFDIWYLFAPGGGPGNTGPDLWAHIGINLGIKFFHSSVGPPFRKIHVLKFSFQILMVVHLLLTCSTSSNCSVWLFPCISFVCLTNSSFGILGHVIKMVVGFHVVNPPLFGHCNGYLSITLSNLLNGRSPDL